MKSYRKIFHTVIMAMVLVLTAACNTQDDKKGVKLSCGDAMTMTEGATEVINVTGTTTFEVSTDNGYVQCTISGTSNITVTALKVGSCRLTVTGEDGSQATCVITINKSAAQKDFEIHSVPRVENWMSETVKTEETPGLQVTQEMGVDVTGNIASGVTTYGFYYTESGAYCRLSARGNFMKRGILADGMVAIYNPGEPVQYYLCEKVEVVNVLNDKIWIVASMVSHADIRIVTELF